MSTAKKEYKRITVKTLVDMKANGEKISMLTAYDYTMAKIVDGAGIDVILVGDSASNVMAGHETTLPITLDQMIYHASSVIRAIERALVVVDLPFGSYQSDPKEALRSAIRIMKESGAHSVKMEGGREIKESIKRILAAGIPVMGHLGLTPQSIYKFGTYTVRAKEEQEAKAKKEQVDKQKEAVVSNSKSSENPTSVVNDSLKTVKATGAVVSGPIPLPTHKRIFTVNRSTFVNKKSREQFELCSYKRLIDIYSSTAKTVEALMKLELPSGVEVEIKV